MFALTDAGAVVTRLAQVPGRVATLPVRMALTVVHDLTDPGRHAWSAPGRAQIDVVLPAESDAVQNMITNVERALRSTAGVDWARVDAVTSRVVVHFDAEVTDVPALVTVVRKAEEANGQDGSPRADHWCVTRCPQIRRRRA